jgi:hypothetical protein
VPFDLFDLLAWLGLAVLVWVIARAIWTRLRPPPPPVLPPDAETIPLPLRRGVWEAFNSPGSKVPSHGTDWLAQRYAIDIVGIEPGVGHSPVRDWRTYVWLEAPERFTGFGAPVVAPTAGEVVAAYDGVGDRGACRSIPALAYFFAGSMALALTTMLTRSSSGLAAMVGNHVIVRLDSGTHAAFMHLRRGSVRVAAGERVAAGQPIGEVGNTGNTTQPHLHFQLMDGPEPRSAKGVPVAFADYELEDGSAWRVVARGMPANGGRIRASG